MKGDESHPRGPWFPGARHLQWRDGQHVRAPRWQRHAGVRRISLATSLHRAAMSGLIEAAREIRENGTFGYLDRCVVTAELARYMQGG